MRSVNSAIRRLPPALRVDIPVAVLLVICWLVVGIAWAHILTGLALTGLIGTHLATRRGVLTRLRRPRQKGTADAAHRLGYGLVLLLTSGMIGSGLLRWTGVPPQFALHATLAYALLAVVVIHIWIVRRSLRARLWRRV